MGKLLFTIRGNLVLNVLLLNSFKIKLNILFSWCFLLFFYISVEGKNTSECGYQISISGIYPHLAYYNNEGECGTGAIVTWADRLWVVTYGQHFPWGSSDKLYEITSDLKQIIRPESVGGTPANRMIHLETNQLFIGPYLIDGKRNVRVLKPDSVPGRLTGVARHLTDPSNKTYLATMEEGFYEVNMNTLATKTLYVDGNVLDKEGKISFRQSNPLLPGCHGKGLYSGQGVLIYSDNGESSDEAKVKFDAVSGSLSEWNGKDWKIIRRNQFTEITGPGGIYGNKNVEKDPIWSVGWDYKSVLLAVRDNDKWSFYRLPKASNSYDGAHGWNTEWPRIRNIAKTEEHPDYLMNMHGMFWSFPGTFSSTNTAGIRPLSAYLKVIGDFTRWNNRLVFGCDDSAQKEFLNQRKIKGDILGSGQSNSNLWFVKPGELGKLGTTYASGSVFMNELVEAGTSSDPFLFSGWKYRTAWLCNKGDEKVEFTFEIDEKGNNKWRKIQTTTVNPGSSRAIGFRESVGGEWIRVRVNRKVYCTVSFVYAPQENRKNSPDAMFSGLASIDDEESKGGLLYGLGDNRRKLGMLVMDRKSDLVTEKSYYEMDETMSFENSDDKNTQSYIRRKLAIPENVVSVENGSVLVTDEKGRRWRLPLGDKKNTELIQKGLTRVCREVATERDLLNCHGTFYELPAENADGFAKIKPITSHRFAIHDFASNRGLMLLTGVDISAKADGKHLFASKDKHAMVWAGAIDDLWKMGKPTGTGGPWVNNLVLAGEKSDPYLIGCYDQRFLTLSHDANADVTFQIEADPTGDGNWMTFQSVKVKSEEVFKYRFPSNVQMRWIRFSVDKACRATTWLEYK